VGAWLDAVLTAKNYRFALCLFGIDRHKAITTACQWFFTDHRADLFNLSVLKSQSQESLAPMLSAASRRGLSLTGNMK
jgi:hypothetical protein